MLHHPVQPAMGKGSRWKGIVALSMAAAGTVSFVIASWPALLSWRIKANNPRKRSIPSVC